MKLISKGLQGLALSLTVLGSVFAIPGTGEASAAERNVKVQVNEQLVQFPDAQPFIDENKRTQVPLRFVSEELGFSVKWTKDKGTVSVYLSNKEGRTVSLTTGDSVALVDGAPYTLEAPPLLEEGRVYVPLRFLSEKSGITVSWDSEHFVAILHENGKDNRTVVKKETQRLRLEYIDTFEATAYSASAQENGGYAGLDYFGNRLQLGTVAVDPKVIPLQTKLYIEGYNFAGLPVGGMYATALDIGGGIHGDRIDIYIPDSRESLMRFGIQTVKVYKVK